MKDHLDHLKQLGIEALEEWVKQWNTFNMFFNSNIPSTTWI
jgi:hypothetical protein